MSHIDDRILFLEEELGFLDWGRVMAEAENDRDVESDENSIARRQVKEGSPILPVGVEAFEPGQYDFMLFLLQHHHKYSSFSDFYASLGITIAEESELTGWVKCQLPEGWSVSYDDTPNPSHDESVHYLMPNGVEAFYLISHKNNEASITTISINRNSFINQ